MLLTGFWLAFLSGTFIFDNAIYVLGLLASSLVIIFFSQGSKLIGKLALATPKIGWLAKFLDVRSNIGQVLTLSTGCVSIWLFLAATFMLFCSSIISFDATPATAAVFILSLTAGYLAGFLAIFAPGGVGVREGVGAAFLSSIVTLEEAVLLMLLFRVWVVLAELAAGAVVLAMRRSAGDKAETDAIGE